MAPGPLLATVVHTVTGEDGSGLAGLSDDQLMGIISAARRLESRTAWTLMAAIGEFAARHAGRSPEDEFAADELADELHLTPLRPGPYCPLGPGRHHLRMRSRSAMSSSP